jgi:microcystin-dependent protein
MSTYKGAVIMWSSPTIPVGWHVCDGSVVNGVTLPDMRGKFVYGASLDDNLGDTGGVDGHTHTQPTSDATNDAHTHGFSGTTGGQSATYTAKSGSGGTGAHSHNFSGTTGSGGGSHSHTMDDTGSASNLPPYVKLYYIVRTQ